MAEQDSLQEKTEAPTPKRLRDARAKGQVPRSRELSGMTVMVAGAGGLILLAPAMLNDLMEVFRSTYVLPRNGDLSGPAIVLAFGDAAAAALSSLVPFLLLVTVAAIGGPLLIGGWAISLQQIAPKAEKINPLKGFKRMFSVRALVELGKAVAKFGVIAAVTWMLLLVLWQPLLGLRASPLMTGLGDAGSMLGWSFLALSAGLVLIAAVDVPFQLWQHSKQLRMTRQEVRDEMKDTEGKPEVRGRIRQMQQQLAQARMMEEVPKADVVITNPTHISVALRYDESRMRAPVVVAKGSDLLALRIRELAQEHDVVVLEAVLLARALYASTELRQAIPAPLYLAVAQVLAFVLQLRLARRHGNKTPSPPQPDVPADFVAALRRANKPI